jgi:hypothetical protein
MCPKALKSSACAGSKALRAAGFGKKHHVAVRPKRWDLFNQGMAEDSLMPHILTLIQDLASRPIVLCTGREELFREATETWLRQHLVRFDALYMRPAKDYRPDYVVKAELLQRILHDGFEPIMAFDDRNSVVAMWRKLGVPCAQVAEGDF